MASDFLRAHRYCPLAVRDLHCAPWQRISGRLHCHSGGSLRSKALRLVSMPNAWITCDEEDAVSRFERQFVLALMILISLPMPAAAAGPPPNAPPGTVCVTPQGWCPAVKRGPPGAPCACQTANGWVQGSLK